MRRYEAILSIFLAGAFVGCTPEENDSEITDLAHAAVHEMGLQIDRCGDERDASCEGTSALAVIAWTVENDEDDGVMINFPDGGILTTEHDPDTGRLQAWTVR